MTTRETVRLTETMSFLLQMYLDMCPSSEAPGIRAHKTHKRPRECHLANIARGDRDLDMVNTKLSTKATLRLRHTFRRFAGGLPSLVFLRPKYQLTTVLNFLSMFSFSIEPSRSVRCLHTCEVPATKSAGMAVVGDTTRCSERLYARPRLAARLLMKEEVAVRVLTDRCKQG